MRMRGLSPPTMDELQQEAEIEFQASVADLEHRKQLVVDDSADAHEPGGPSGSPKMSASPRRLKPLTVDNVNVASLRLAVPIKTPCPDPLPLETLAELNGRRGVATHGPMDPSSP
jgi:hypothetical protein